MVEIFRPREVVSGHGQFAAMGFKWRARLEQRRRKTWFGFGDEVVEFRYVQERHHMSWEDVGWGPWTTESAAHQAACRLLDAIEAKPSGTYVS